MVPGELRRAGRPIQALRPLHGPGGRGHPNDQFGRPLPVPGCLGVRVDPLRRPRGRDGGRQGAARVAGLVPVVRQPRGQPRLRWFALTGQGERIAAMDLDALAGEQIGNDDLGHQAVPQPVSVSVLVDKDNTLFDRFPYRLEKYCRRLVEHFGEKSVRQWADAGGHCLRHPLRRR